MSFPNNIDPVVSQYNEAMTFLANTTSRSVTIFTDPIRTGCPNDQGYDPVEKRAIPIYNSGNPFSTTDVTVIPSFGINGILNIPFSGCSCPVCRGEGFLFSPASGTLKARIQWRNEETNRDYSSIKFDSEKADVRLKITGAADKDLMDRSKRVLVDGILCEKTKAGVPFGLRDIFEYHYYFRKTV